MYARTCVCTRTDKERGKGKELERWRGGWEAQGAGRQTGKERMGGGGEACHVGEVPPWPMDDPKSLK